MSCVAFRKKKRNKKNENDTLWGNLRQRQVEVDVDGGETEWYILRTYFHIHKQNCCRRLIIFFCIAPASLDSNLCLRRKFIAVEISRECVRPFFTISLKFLFLLFVRFIFLFFFRFFSFCSFTFLFCLGSGFFSFLRSSESEYNAHFISYEYEYECSHTEDRSGKKRRNETKQWKNWDYKYLWMRATMTTQF